MIAVPLFALVSVAVAVRMLLLWRRTRRKPELLMSLALLGTGLIGFALGVLARRMTLSPTLSSVLQVLDLGGEYVGATATLVFAALVFRPGVSWARAWVGVWCAAAAGCLGWEILSGEYIYYTNDDPITGLAVPIGLGVRAVAFLWMTAEAWRSRQMMKRRLKLGLAEPTVVNRIGLWMTASAASGVGYALSVVHRSVYGTGLTAHAWALGIAGACALVAAVCLGLAFFPPAAYERWIDARAEARS